MHLHGIALAGALSRAAIFTAAGVALLVVGWPGSLAAPALLGLAALIALRAAWRWERTRIVVTADRVVVEFGTVRRRAAWAPISTLELEQGLLGRVLGYGTVVAGDLAVPHVPIRRIGALAGGLPGR